MAIFSNMRKYWEEIKGHVTIFSNTCMGSGGGSASQLHKSIYDNFIAHIWAMWDSL